MALSVYLGFRNNAAYDRWWEARKLWGQLVFDIRNLSRASIGVDRGSESNCAPLLMDSMAFCHFLRGQLRKVDARPRHALLSVKTADKILAKHANQPDAMLRRMGQRIAAL